MDLLSILYGMFGKSNVLTDQCSMEPYLKDWRCRYHGNALAIVRPNTVSEVKKIVRFCSMYNLPLVPQGGNTSMCGAATPDSSGNSIVMSMIQLNRVRKLDTENNSVTVEAGCTLHFVQAIADSFNKLFPLSLAAERHCTIGGNLATNAGGMQVIQYGNMRDLTLGIEIVTARGELISNLSGLRKDNCGYNLRDIFIGSEGTLGIFTAATLKLFSKPFSKHTILFATNSIESSIDLFLFLRDSFPNMLTAFEVMNRSSLEFVFQAFPKMQFPFDDFTFQCNDWFVLGEISVSKPEFDQAENLKSTLSKEVLGKRLAKNFIMANNLSKSRHFWNLRSSIPLAESAMGKSVKHDISLPISAIAKFLKKTNSLIEINFPDARQIIFGHIGDGNLHYSVSRISNPTTDQGFLDFQHSIHKIIHTNVRFFGGSICAEHGVGQLKRDEIEKYKSQAELEVMKKIKDALDPLSILNPGKILNV